MEHATIVFQTLRSAPGSTAQEISRRIGGISRSSVNVVLYTLQKNGFVTMQPGSSPPRWSAANGVIEIPQAPVEQEAPREPQIAADQVISLIPADQFVETSELLKVLKCDRKELNATLYDLMEQGRIVKQSEENGAKPRWRRVQ